MYHLTRDQTQAKRNAEAQVKPMGTDDEYAFDEFDDAFVKALEGMVLPGDVPPAPAPPARAPTTNAIAGPSNAPSLKPKP